MTTPPPPQETAGVKDDEKEPLHVGAHYLLSGVVKRNDLAHPPPSSSAAANRGEIWLERAALSSLGRDADVLAAAHRRALWRQAQPPPQKPPTGPAAAAAAAAWDAALKAHFAQRGVGGRVAVGARSPRQPRQERPREEEAERQGLLLAPHVPGRR